MKSSKTENSSRSALKKESESVDALMKCVPQNLCVQELLLASVPVTQLYAPLVS